MFLSPPADFEAIEKGTPKTITEPSLNWVSNSNRLVMFENHCILWLHSIELASWLKNICSSKILFQKIDSKMVCRELESWSGGKGLITKCGWNSIENRLYYRFNVFFCWQIRKLLILGSEIINNIRSGYFSICTVKNNCVYDKLPNISDKNIWWYYDQCK